MCDKDQSWDSFFVAGAVFGEFGQWHSLSIGYWLESIFVFQYWFWLRINIFYWKYQYPKSMFFVAFWDTKINIQNQYFFRVFERQKSILKINIFGPINSISALELQLFSAFYCPVWSSCCKSPSLSQGLTLALVTRADPGPCHKD